MYLYAMEYCIAMKKDKLEASVGKSTQFANVMLSKITEVLKLKYGIVFLK